VHLDTGSYFRSRDEDGGHAISSAEDENALLHADFTGLCVSGLLVPDEFNARGSGYVGLPNSPNSAK